jgi:two-component system, LytTR family, sensor kinase
MASEGLRTSRVVAVALVVGIFFVSQEVFIDLADGKSAKIGPRLVVALCFWLAWAPLAPLVRIALRRWPLDTRPIYRPLLAHAAVALTLGTVQATLALGLQGVVRWIRQGGSLLAVFARFEQGVPLVWTLFVGLIFYAVVVMVYAALRFRGLYVAEQTSAEALRAELTQSKLDALRSQVRPHFLFNTLNAISVFVTEDAEKAQQMLLRLSTLLRRSLDEEAHEVTLEQELRFANDYLDIQRGRFGDELQVHLAVDPTVLDARVPVFLLQPLLENVMEHGKVADTVTTITLCASLDHGCLHITLEDDGPGIPAGVRVSERVGLSNTRARLLQLYGPSAAIELHAASPGARVEIRIPYESPDRRR